MVDGKVRAPDLRELEVGLGHGQAVCGSRSTEHLRRLIGVRVRIERPCRGVVDLLETGQQAVLAELVGDPDVEGPAGEDARATADLGLPVTAHVPVEAHARRDQQVGVGELLGLELDVVPALVAEGEPVRLGIGEAGLAEPRGVEAQAEGQLQVIPGPELILGVDAGVGHFHRLQRLLEARDVGPAHLETPQ